MIVNRVLFPDLFVFRPPLAQIPTNLRKVCEDLKITKYQKGTVDCLTVIEDIFAQATKERWALDFIANMPRQLVSKYKFTIEKGVQPGDVIFLANEKGLIRHVVLAIPPKPDEIDPIFHCSQANKGGKIENLGTLFLKRYKSQSRMYCEIKGLKHLMGQIDPRTKDPEVRGAMKTLAGKILFEYYMTHPISLSDSLSTVCLRPHEPEEMKENGYRIRIVVPPNRGSNPNLMQCSPTYVFDTKGPEEDLREKSPHYQRSFDYRLRSQPNLCLLAESLSPKAETATGS